MLRRIRPDLRIEALRGNVGTRLEKARNGEFDAVVLAMAGLKRLGLEDHATEALDPARFIPAVGQGAIALVARADDVATLSALAAIIDPATGIALGAERAFLAVLDGSCRTPIGGHARLVGDKLLFKGIVLAPDGQIAREIAGEAPPGEAATLGRRLGEALRAELPAGILPA
jgi:hydroxymethylbilane synthase